jgi:hypothetical protein
MEFHDTVKKPIPVLPMSPNKIDVKFDLYTFESRDKFMSLKYNPKKSTLLRSTFNPKHSTVIVVHGFRSGIQEWMKVFTLFLDKKYALQLS